MGEGEGGSFGAKVEKVIAVEAATCSADAAEHRLICMTGYSSAFMPAGFS